MQIITDYQLLAIHDLVSWKNHVTVTIIVLWSSKWCCYNEFIGKIFLIVNIEVFVISEFDFLPRIVLPLMRKQRWKLFGVIKTLNRSSKCNVSIPIGSVLFSDHSWIGKIHQLAMYLRVKLFLEHEQHLEY